MEATQELTGVEKLNFLQRLKLHPPGFWFIFWGELAERASYYGMRVLLAEYLVHNLLYSESGGAKIVSFFMAGCYLATLLGGWLADRVLGRYKTILIFSLPYIAGHFILGGIEQRWAMFVALFFLALGSGSIKPNTTTLMGQMYESQKKKALLTEAFSYFYASINIGSLGTTLVLPYVAIHYGYAKALMGPAYLMVASFGAFALGKRFYPQETISRTKKTKEQKRAEITTLKRIAAPFLLIALFWFVYDQSASVWIYFAAKHMSMKVLPFYTATAEINQWMNPAFIILLTPVFNWLWAFWARKSGREVKDTSKMLVGFVILTFSMAMMTIPAYLAESGQVSVWWQIIATFIITLSELCISVVGLEFAYKVAAPGTKSVVTAAFLFTVTIGDTIGGFFDALYGKISDGSFFALQTLCSVVALVLFVFVARRFERTVQRANEDGPLLDNGEPVPQVAAPNG